MQMRAEQIIVFGTGYSGNCFIKEIAMYNQICDKFNLSSEKVTVKCCIDNNSEKIGSVFLGYEVISASEYGDYDSKKKALIVIATSDYYEEIATQLKNMGFVHELDFIDFKKFFFRRITRLIQEKKNLLFCNEVLNGLTFSYVDKTLMQSVRYQLGRTLIEETSNKNEGSYLLRGIKILKEIFNLGYEQEKIKRYFDEKFYMSMAEQMYLQYDENRDIIYKLYHIDFPKVLKDFYFIVYPLSQSSSKWCCFDKMEQKIIFYEENSKRKIISKYDIVYKIFLEKLPTFYIEAVFEALKKIEDDIHAYVISRDVQVMIDRQEILNENCQRKIEEYRKLKPFAEGYYWMMGQYYFKRKEYDLSLKILVDGLTYNPYSQCIYSLMGDIYFILNKWKEAAASFLMADFKKLRLRTDMDIYKEIQISSITKEKLIAIVRQAEKVSEMKSAEIMKELSDIVSSGRFFPWRNCLILNKKGNLEVKSAIAIDEPLTKNQEQCFLSIEGNQYQKTPIVDKLEKMSQDAIDTTINPMHLWSVLAGEKTKNITIEQKCLLPLMIRKPYQFLNFEYEEATFQYGVGGVMAGDTYERFIPYKVEYLRIEEKLKIDSNEDMIVGKPILLEHAKQRKKLVLNVLVDGLSYLALKKNSELMPNTMRFFSHGTIFTNAYSSAEWTVAAVAAMNSGCYQERTMAYYANVPKSQQFPKTYKTIAEHMNDKGYYCVNLSAALFSLVYSDIYRGFHKSVGSREASSDVLVMQCLNHLQALNETDLFINMHLLDVHDSFYLMNHKMGVYAKNDWKKMLRLDKILERKKKSVDVVYDDFVYAAYMAEIKNTDEKLGILFDYITSHYREDEYAVILHADHGSGCAEMDDFLLNDAHTNIPLMVRGKNIPTGIVTDEMVSGIDLYAIYSYLCGYEIDKSLDCSLPKVFGGNGREYTISSSSYPGQPYKLALRDSKGEFRMETLESVDFYGKVNMDIFNCEFFTKDGGEKFIHNTELERKYCRIAKEHAKYILR